MRSRLLLCLLLTAICRWSSAQPLSNLRQLRLLPQSDTLTLDSCSFAPGSVRITDLNGNRIDTSCYSEDWGNARIIIHRGNSCFTDSVNIRYRVLSVFTGQEFRHKDPLLLQGKGAAAPDPFRYQPTSDNELRIFNDKGVNANGSISRGVSFGNNQDVFVNSSLNLQLSGKLNDDVELLASITDENIPIQPEGNTQQLQEFDKVFIQLSKDRSRLVAGDFELRRPDSYFMNFFKRGQGVSASTSFSLTDSSTSSTIRRLNSSAAIAIAKGRFARQVIQGLEGNQGPYRLKGNDGENFIIVLSGTERVYIDGALMTRGMQNDYVIDYNSAEVTFTPRRLITKDSRIIVEFEYSDRNYVRSLLFLNNEYVSDKAKLKLNIYSEQDSKNQPLLQQVDTAQRAIMANAGDDINEAYYPTADSLTQYDGSQVLYIKTDTVTATGTFRNVYIYSEDTLRARWRVTFTETGPNSGDYVLDVSAANGRVFKWVAPDSTGPKGNYRPVQLLITPKQRRMITLGGDFKLATRKKLSAEAALSDNDINLYAGTGKSNDRGTAAKLNYQQYDFLSEDTINSWKLDSRIDYEYTSKYFKPLDPYRAAEFVRDWNRTGSTDTSDEHLFTGNINLSQPKTGTAAYQLKTYQRPGAYSGWNNQFNANLNLGKINLSCLGSYLNTTTNYQKSGFLRHHADVSRSWKNVVIGLRENAETNLFHDRSSDSLLTGSYAWQELGGYATIHDSLQHQGTVSVKSRLDRAFLKDKLVDASFAKEVAASAELGNVGKSTLRNTTTFRDLQILNDSAISVAPNQTLVNRLDHQATIAGGILTTTAYYEVGSGRDRKQEFYYLNVPTGQGAYTYRDFNGNGIKELNEFVISTNPADTSYIRVYYNSNQYQSTRSNSFSEVLNINPAAAKKASSARKFHQRFTDQFLLRLDKKTKGEDVLSSLNPFSRSITDSSLVSTNSTYRNTLYFNRTDPAFGFDYTWQDVRNKSQLVSGFDLRRSVSHLLSIRWNFTQAWQSTLALGKQDQKSAAGYFEDRNFRIASDYAEPAITWQPKPTFRTTLSYRSGQKTNMDSSGERLIENKLSLEGKLNAPDAGVISARLNYIRLDYTGKANSYIAYEMLEGLNPGVNYTWTLSLLRNLSSVMQLNLNYEGRKSENRRTLHTANVQFRAFF